MPAWEEVVVELADVVSGGMGRRYGCSQSRGTVSSNLALRLQRLEREETQGQTPACQARHGPDGGRCT